MKYRPIGLRHFKRRRRNPPKPGQLVSSIASVGALVGVAVVGYQIVTRPGTAIFDLFNETCTAFLLNGVGKPCQSSLQCSKSVKAILDAGLAAPTCTPVNGAAVAGGAAVTPPVVGGTAATGTGGTKAVGWSGSAANGACNSSGRIFSNQHDAEQVYNQSGGGAFDGNNFVAPCGSGFVVVVGGQWR